MSEVNTDLVRQLIIERLKKGFSFKDISDELSVNKFLVVSVALSLPKSMT